MDGRARLAPAFLTLQSAALDFKLTCGLFWHLHYVDKRQQITLWTEIESRMTEAAHGGHWVRRLEDVSCCCGAVGDTWGSTGWLHRGKRRVLLSPVLESEPVANGICRRLSNSGKDFFSYVLCKASGTTSRELSFGCS